MPSPFPGMDPFLEDPGLWPDVHHEIISEARALLNRGLGAKYVVRIQERVCPVQRYRSAKTSKRPLPGSQT